MSRFYFLYPIQKHFELLLQTIVNTSLPFSLFYRTPSLCTASTESLSIPFDYNNPDYLIMSMITHIIFFLRENIEDVKTNIFFYVLFLPSLKLYSKNEGQSDINKPICISDIKIKFSLYWQTLKEIFASGKNYNIIKYFLFYYNVSYFLLYFLHLYWEKIKKKSEFIKYFLNNIHILDELNLTEKE